jgi:MFS family permease
LKFINERGLTTSVLVAMMMSVTVATSPSFIYGASVLLGVGTGSCINAAYSVATAKASSIPEEEMPGAISSAIGFMNLAQVGAIMHALAISGAVYQNLSFRFLKTVFEENGLNFIDAEISSAVAGSKSLVFANLDEDIRKLAIDAIVESIKNVYGLVVTGGAVCLIAGLCMRREKLFMEVTGGG